MNPQEKQWATLLHKARQTPNQGDGLSFTMRRKNILESLRRAKQFLRDAVDKKDHVEAKKFLTSLIKLRAEQTVLTLEELEEQYGSANDHVLRAYIQQYLHDCAALVRATQTILFTIKK